MIGPGYWATGVTCKWTDSQVNGPGWSAELKFYDSGVLDDDPDAGVVSTQGTLTTRYYVHGENGLTAALDVLIADAGRLGITLGQPGRPSLYVPGDGEAEDVELPPDWLSALRAAADRLGWETYGLERVDAVRVDAVGTRELPGGAS